LAKSNAYLLHRATVIAPGSTVLLHFNNHIENIEWLWSVIAAGYLPAISTPFTNDVEQRRKHILHLQKLLVKPVVITSEVLLPEFETVDDLNIQTIEQIRSKSSEQADSASLDEGLSKEEDDVAILMLTSGSTGNAKAVTLQHGQILEAIHK